VYEQINTQLAEAREKIRRLANLKASLIPARERLTDQAHVVKGIEECLESVEDEIQSLESRTLKGLINSLLSKKEARLDQLREEAGDLAPQVEIGEQMLLDMEAGVKEIEAEMASLSNAEESYKELCEKKGEQILSECGQAAIQLQEIAEMLKAAKNERQSLRKSLQIAKSLMDRVRSMSKAVGRTRSKALQSVGLGAIGNAVATVVHRQGPEGAVRRAEDGVSQLAGCIESLNLQHGCERDAELGRVAVLLSHSNGDLSAANTASSPIRDLISKAMDLLQSKLDEAETEVMSLETRRIKLIENA